MSPRSSAIRGGDPSRGPAIAAVVLAAGSGSRYGKPKALVEGWLEQAVGAVSAAGCSPVVVVLGAEADLARGLVPPGARVAVAENWALGMGASLRAGLAALRGDTADADAHADADADADAVVVHLVDMPGVSAAVVERLCREVRDRSCLVRAVYGGQAGHPVILGRDHWEGAARAARGDRGARDYLGERAVTGIECADLFDGVDIDEPPPVAYDGSMIQDAVDDA